MSTLVEREGTLRRTAASGTDIFEVTARLESSGVSRAVARAQGHDSVFDYAERLIEAVPDAEAQPARARREARNRASVRASLVRAAVMVFGVVVCATSLPPAPEMAIFLMAASGWVAGQAVSAAAWYAWGAGRRRDGMAAAGIVGGALLVIGAVAAAVSGLPELMIWIGIGVATPVLLLLASGVLLVLVGAVAAALCLVSLFARNHYEWAPAALGPVGTPLAFGVAILAVVVALILLIRENRGGRARYIRGAATAVGVALLQTLFQLTVLLQIFLGVGAGEFGAVALAVMAAGALSDPLFTLQMAWAHKVAQRSASWGRGRFAIGIVAVCTVVIVLGVTAFAVILTLADPYRITLNAPAIVAAAVLCSAVICATNILLRTGSRIGAMLFAALSELLVAVTLLFPADEPSGFYAMAIMAAVLTVLAFLIAATRFGHPSTW